jgi:hypothetical protein
MHEDQVAAIDNWRDKNEVSRPEAIRRLVDFRAEGEEVNRLRKYIERTADGRALRTACAMTRTALPDPRPRSRWSEENNFSAADEALANPALKTVFKAAIERGFAVVPESGLKPKVK